MAEKLEKSKRLAALEALSGWEEHKDRDAITKKFVFRDFNEAFGFMGRVALLAEKMDHHPEWLNVYRQVEVVLTTHSVDGVSELDIEMARKMDEFAAS